MKSNRKTKQPSPAIQGEVRSPINGAILPAEHQFKPGKSGNPAGRPANAGLSVREWHNALAGSTQAELRRVVDDPACPAHKRAAGINWLHATTEGTSKSGTPLAESALELICDQTAGKAVQPIELSADVGIAKSGVAFDFSGFAAMFALQAREAGAIIDSSESGPKQFEGARQTDASENRGVLPEPAPAPPARANGNGEIETYGPVSFFRKRPES